MFVLSDLTWLPLFGEGRKSWYIIIIIIIIIIIRIADLLNLFTIFPKGLQKLNKYVKETFL